MNASVHSCFMLLVIFSTIDSGVHSGGTRLSLAQWINLLNYANKTLTREPVVNHTTHFNYTEHVELISDNIVKYFFNDVIEAVNYVNEEGKTKAKLLFTRIPVDFLILLDSSASLGSENFEKAIRALVAWVGVLEESDFSSDNVRVSMVSYSERDKSRRHVPFSSYQNKSHILKKINSTDYQNGRSTSSALALWLAEAIFRKTSRENVNRVMLLVTDGWSNDAGLPFGVLWPAAKLKVKLGVKIFVLGIGDQINHNELKALASRPTEDYLYEILSYQMMTDVMTRVQEKAQSLRYK